MQINKRTSIERNKVVDGKKICGICHHALEVKCFYKTGISYSSRCRECTREYLKNKVGSKVCRICNQKKNYCEFSIAKNSFNYMCKSCKAEKYKNRYSSDESFRKKRNKNSIIHRKNNPEVYKKYRVDVRDSGRGKVYTKRYYNKDIDKKRLVRKNQATVARDELKDRYVKAHLKKTNKITEEFISPELLDVKRLQIKLIRTIKKQKNGKK